LFPYQGAFGTYLCDVATTPEVTVGANGAGTLIGVLPAQSNTTEEGATPAGASLALSYQQLNSTSLPGPKVAILITDGAANCAPGQTGVNAYEVFDSSVETAVANAYNNDGIPTYIVGIDIANQTSGGATDGEPNNTNPYIELNKLATAGGTALGGTTKFYDTQNQAQLLSDLQSVINSLQSCTISLQNAPLFPDLTEVRVGGTLVTPYHMGVYDCTGQTSGWVYTSTNYDEIELCGSDCTALGAQGSADVTYKCMGGS